MCLNSQFVKHTVKLLVNLIIPVVTVRTARFNIQQFYVLPTQCVYGFVWISEQTAIISLCSIN
jgi:hypothetical protein